MSLTWRSQLGVAGRAGQRQALAKPVHAVEADGDVGLGHGLQIFCRGKGHPVGLVSESRLWRAESGHARSASLQHKGKKFPRQSSAESSSWFDKPWFESGEQKQVPRTDSREPSPGKPGETRLRRV